MIHCFFTKNYNVDFVLNGVFSNVIFIFVKSLQSVALGDNFNMLNAGGKHVENAFFLFTNKS